MIRVYRADAREVSRLLEPASIQAVVTSPPYYWRRDYGVEALVWGGQQDCAHAWEADSCVRCGAWRGQLGLEPDPDLFVAHLVEVFREVRKVLRPTGVCWINIGDGYRHSGENRNGLYGAVSGSRGKLQRLGLSAHALGPRPSGQRGLVKLKELYLVPQRLAIALQEDGWWVRSVVIWRKPNSLPDEQPDRPALDYEFVLMLTAGEDYWFDREPIGERDPFWEASGRRHGAVWSIPVERYDGPHLAVMPERLAERCILASTRPGDVVLDPFCGSGTVLRVADRLQRHAVGLDLSPAYVALSEQRVADNQLSFGW